MIGLKKTVNYLNIVFPILVIILIGINENEVIKSSLIRLTIGITLLILGIGTTIMNIKVISSKEIL